MDFQKDKRVHGCRGANDDQYCNQAPEIEMLREAIA